MIGRMSSFLSCTCIWILNWPGEPSEIGTPCLSRRGDVTSSVVSGFNHASVLWQVYSTSWVIKAVSGSFWFRSSDFFMFYSARDWFIYVCSSDTNWLCQNLASTSPVYTSFMISPSFLSRVKTPFSWISAWDLRTSLFQMF